MHEKKKFLGDLFKEIRGMSGFRKSFLIGLEGNIIILFTIRLLTGLGRGRRLLDVSIDGLTST